MAREKNCERGSILILRRDCLTFMVTPSKVIEVLERPVEDRNGREGSRVALGQTDSGRYLRVIYVPDPERDSVFVITAYELDGKPLAAFRRRRRKKHQ